MMIVTIVLATLVAASAPPLGEASISSTRITPSVPLRRSLTVRKLVHSSIRTRSARYRFPRRPKDIRTAFEMTAAVRESWIRPSTIAFCFLLSILPSDSWNESLTSSANPACKELFERHWFRHVSVYCPSILLFYRPSGNTCRYLGGCFIILYNMFCIIYLYFSMFLLMSLMEYQKCRKLNFHFIQTKGPKILIIVSFSLTLILNFIKM